MGEVWEQAKLYIMVIFESPCGGIGGFKLCSDFCSYKLILNTVLSTRLPENCGRDHCKILAKDND